MRRAPRDWEWAIKFGRAVIYSPRNRRKAKRQINRLEWHEAKAGIRRAMTIDLASMTWTCHVCHRERLDESISVLTTKLDLNGVVAYQNVRYCNDEPTCIFQAPSIRFIPEETE